MALSVSWGGDWQYLTRHAEDGLEIEGPAISDNYYLQAADHGEPAGRWLGKGAQSLGLTGEVAHEQMADLYGKLLHPLTGELMGSAPRQYATAAERFAKAAAREPGATPERLEQLAINARKDNREARLYADMTFSPAKSWSVLHASLERAGRLEEAALVWEAWMVGVEASMEYLQAEAGYSRSGYHGKSVTGRSTGRYVDAHDWVMSTWRHHTSRDGDPQLHVHVAVLNRVLCDDGVWRTIDSTAVRNARPAAEALCNRVAEQALTRSLGVTFLTRPDGAAREVAGISADARDLFSSRRRAISKEVADLAAEYEERHGIAPKAFQLTMMAQHATLKTRARKLVHPPSRAELLDDWENKAASRLGTSLEEVLEGVKFDMDRPVDINNDVDLSKVVDLAVASMQARKAVWSRFDLIGQIDRYLPDSLRGLEPHVVKGLFEELADEALGANGDVVCLTAPDLVPAPAELRRADGRSIYEAPGVERYATLEQLSTEERLMAMARTTGGFRLAEDRVAEFLERSSLSAEQAAAVAGIVTSSKRVEILTAAAGAGKSYTMGKAAELWEAEGGTVIGVAVAEAAVGVLANEGVDRTINLSKFLAVQQRIQDGTASRSDRRAFTLGPKSLVVLDEASMMATGDLERAVAIAHQAGAKVLLTGDDRQLGAVGAGGAMRLLITEVGAHELDEVRRFEASWEGPASLGLRRGDTDVLWEYDRRGRFISGSLDEVADEAYKGFLGDYLAGKTSLLIVANNEQAAQLSSRVREDLVRGGRVEDKGLQLHDNTVAGRGDLIQARRNDRFVVDPDGRRVVNRDVYKVVHRLDDGGLRVRRVLSSMEDLGPELTLPKAYVQNDVELAYAVTAHGAQGRTVSRGHLLVDEGLGRAAFYVGMTRGREENLAYVVTTTKATEHDPEVEHEAVAKIAAVMERVDEAEKSAIEVMRDELTHAESLSNLGFRWSDSLAEESRRRYDALLVEVLGPRRAEAVAKDDAAGALFRLIRGVEVAGQNPAAVIRTAVAQRELGSADSLAQVLHWRITNNLQVPDSSIPSPPWVVANQADGTWRRTTYAERTPKPDVLEGPERQSLSGPNDRGAVYAKYARELAVAMDRRAADLGNETAEKPPAWAIEAWGPVPDEPLAREEWVERATSVAAYREQYSLGVEVEGIGPAPKAGGDSERRAAWTEAWAALGRPPASQDVRSLSDAELEANVVAYERELAWMPQHVPADELKAAHETARKLEQQATFERAGIAQRSPASRERAKTMAAVERQRVADLEVIVEGRARALEHTADKAQAAAYSEQERSRRAEAKTARNRSESEHVEDEVVSSDQRRPERPGHDLSTTEGRQRAKEQVEVSNALINERVARAERQQRQEQSERRAYDYNQQQAASLQHDQGVERGRSI